MKWAVAVALCALGWLTACAGPAQPGIEKASDDVKSGTATQGRGTVVSPVVAKQLGGVETIYKGPEFTVRLERILQRPENTGMSLYARYTLTNTSASPVSTCDVGVTLADSEALVGQKVTAKPAEAVCDELVPGASALMETAVNAPAAGEPLHLSLLTPNFEGKYSVVARFAVPAESFSPVPAAIAPVKLEGREITVQYVSPALGPGGGTLVEYAVKNIGRDTVYLCHGFWPVLTDVPVEEGKLSVWGFDPGDNTCKSFAPGEVGEYSVVIAGEFPAAGLQLSIQSPSADSGTIKEWGKIPVGKANVAGN